LLVIIYLFIYVFYVCLFVQAGYDIETEYLSEMDPLHIVHSPEAATIIETDAGKEVVEGTSFRKISRQEFTSVQVDQFSFICQAYQ
jgi:hypothetical protein